MNTITTPEQLSVVVLAGGQGNGLFPLTVARPKPGLAFGPSRMNEATNHSMLCDGVHVGDGAQVEDCVLMPGAKIDRRARLRRVIVDEGVEIPEGFSAGWDTDADRLHHIVSPGGVVVVNHVPRAPRFHLTRERVSAPARREPDPTVKLRREGA